MFRPAHQKFELIKEYLQRGYSVTIIDNEQGEFRYNPEKYYVIDRHLMVLNDNLFLGWNGGNWRCIDNATITAKYKRSKVEIC